MGLLQLTSCQAHAKIDAFRKHLRTEISARYAMYSTVPFDVLCTAVRNEDKDAADGLAIDSTGQLEAVLLGAVASTPNTWSLNSISRVVVFSHGLPACDS